jgi:uncharacterized membrane protein YedE/YeeE
MENDGKPWSPYLAGVLSGIVSIGSVWFTGKYFGASTTFVRTSGMLEKIVSPERVAQMEYFIKEVPKVDWQSMFLVGIFIGALIAAGSDRSFGFQGVPSLWEQRFGPDKIKRGVVAFLGGIVAMFGARLADGCPSGHGLSGSMQMALSGYLSLACFFIGGIIMARLLYAGGAR